MTAKQKLMEKPQFKNIYHFLDCGMVDLIEATEAIAEQYRRGALTHSEATEGIRILAKVKTPA